MSVHAAGETAAAAAAAETPVGGFAVTTLAGATEVRPETRSFTIGLERARVHGRPRPRARPSACTARACGQGGSDAAASAAVGGASDESRAAASASTSSRAPSTRRS